MKFNTFTLIVSFVLLCTLIMLTGCEEQQTRRERLDPSWFDQPVWNQIRTGSTRNARNPMPYENTAMGDIAPKIMFANNIMSHDFGRVSPSSTDSICEFIFTNAGNSDLVITDLKTSCDCTPAKLENNKTVYAPGESGRIIAGYTDTQLGENLKHIYLATNDPQNPIVELAIIAEVVAPVEYEPKKLNLSLMSANGAAPDIVIRSLDNEPFSITGFESNGSCISIDYNPNQKATQFVLRPKVDTEVLNMIPEGKFNIHLSHPDCKVVSGTYYAPPRFAISPKRLTLNNVDSSRTFIKTINITSNYGEDFDLNTTFSNQSIMRITERQKMRNGYRLTLEINPPNARNGEKMFTENINLALPGIDTFTVQCNGYYPGASAPVNLDEECKTCGPVRVDKPSMSKYPR